MGHEDAAARIQEEGVDILVDLQGHTLGGRSEIVAARPAPIQANYRSRLHTSMIGTDFGCLMPRRFYFMVELVRVSKQKELSLSWLIRAHNTRHPLLRYTVELIPQSAVNK